MLCSWLTAVFIVPGLIAVVLCGCALLNCPPVASFSASPTTGPAPLTVELDASASSDPDGDPITYSWNFGDGTTASGTVTTHTYATESHYVIQLIVTDSHGHQSMATQLILVTSQTCRDRYRDPETGVEIICTTEPDMFPPSWQEFNPRATSVRPSEVERSMEIIFDALGKYPAIVMEENLGRVYVVGSLEFKGVSYAATNSRDTIYMTNRGRSEGYTNVFIERLFHAEFSSILLRNYRDSFPEESWLAANPEEFEYGESGAEAILTGRASEDMNPKLLKQGFLTEYGMSTMENDFNSYAKHLMTQGSIVLECAKRYPRVQKKIDVFIAFYCSIHPEFTAEYFLSL